MDTAGAIRTILLVDIVTMSLLAVVYLRQRRMDWLAYCAWGLLALLVPVLGPFLVIANRPGQWDPDFSLTADLKRAVQLLRRLLPEQVIRLSKQPRLLNAQKNGKKISRLDRARQRRQLRGDDSERK
jgi:hypothetical protein